MHLGDDAGVQRDALTSFQRECARRLDETIAEHGLGRPTWSLKTDGRHRLEGHFEFEGKAYRIEIYSDVVVMHQDDDRRYFESYMPEEFRSESSLIEGFASRLDRFLSGGDWAGPDEKGSAGSIKAGFKRLFRR